MIKILLVEDELSLRELYAEFLRDAGYSVDEAGDGETAVFKINQGDWDLLLLDIMLPKLDGMEILKVIRSNQSLNFKPVLVMSNLEDSSVINKCMSYGAKEFLLKADINPPEIIKAIERHTQDGSENDNI